MFIMSFQLVFILILVLGTLVAVSANTWFTSWLGLEINLMSMLPLMLMSCEHPMVEASIKYFLTQALASTLLIITTSLHLSFFAPLKMDTMEVLILLALLMKAGIPPLHFWFPNIMNNLKWMQCLVLLTWQKVAPLLLLSSCKTNKIMLIASLSLVVGTIGGLNQLFMKVLMTYSSIAHSGWILMAAAINTLSCFFYFFIYCFLSFSIIFMLFKAPLKKISELAFWSESMIKKYTLIFNMLALGGLPPFLGFAASLSIIIYLTQMDLSLLGLMFILLSLVSLFYYFRVTYSFVLSSHTQKISPQLFSSRPLNTLLFLSISFNILVPLINSLF